MQIGPIEQSEWNVQKTTRLRSTMVLLLGWFMDSSAQSVANVRASQTEDDQIVVSYDLTGGSYENCEISLLLSRDGGQNFDMIPRTVGGDVGKGVNPGRGKKIVWDVLMDVPRLQGSNFVFRVERIHEENSLESGKEFAKLSNAAGSSPFRPAYSSNTTNLSWEGARAMVIRNGFYHSIWNKRGGGLDNDLQRRKDDKVLYDRATNLMWQKNGSTGLMKLTEAYEYVHQLNVGRFAGFNDWRLPTLEEAMSLMEPKKSIVDRYLTSVFDGAHSLIWTSDKAHAKAGWIVNYDTGSCYDFNVGLGLISVRAVRSGQ